MLITFSENTSKYGFGGDFRKLSRTVKRKIREFPDSDFEQNEALRVRTGFRAQHEKRRPRRKL